MFSQLARRAVRPVASAARRQFADAAPAAGLMKLNFNLPQETLYDSVSVKSVVVPGATGEYEVTADHVPIVAELKAGMLTINHEDGEEEKYFVAGGFSLTHEGSTTVREILYGDLYEGRLLCVISFESFLTDLYNSVLHYLFHKIDATITAINEITKNRILFVPRL